MYSTDSSGGRSSIDKEGGKHTRDCAQCHSFVVDICRCHALSQPCERCDTREPLALHQRVHAAVASRVLLFFLASRVCFVDTCATLSGAHKHALALARPHAYARAHAHTHTHTRTHTHTHTHTCLADTSDPAQSQSRKHEEAWCPADPPTRTAFRLGGAAGDPFDDASVLRCAELCSRCAAWIAVHAPRDLGTCSKGERCCVLESIWVSSCNSQKVCPAGPAPSTDALVSAAAVIAGVPAGASNSREFYVTAMFAGTPQGIFGPQGKVRTCFRLKNLHAVTNFSFSAARISLGARVRRCNAFP